MGNIIVVGALGKMGAQICEKLKTNYTIIKVDKRFDCDSYNNLKDVHESVDLVVDFSVASNTADVVEFCKKNNARLVVGTTGQTNSQKEEIFDLSKRVPVMMCANFSVGVNLLQNMIDCMNGAVPSEIIISETHHKEKKDCPSGTALNLINKVCEKFGYMYDQSVDLNNARVNRNHISVHCTRAGEITGEHKIELFFDGEKITLCHYAFSREAFVRGACDAVEYMLNQTKAKLYNFNLKEIYAKN